MDPGTDMYRRLVSPRTICLAALLAVSYGAAAAERLSMQQMLLRILETYPSLRVASLEVARASQDSARVEGQLSWVLGAQAGAGHQLSFFGTPSDRFDAGATLSRRLASGNSVEFGAGYAYEDSTVAFSPFIPNPSHRTTIDANLRVPLQRGSGNPEYEQASLIAEAQTEIARASWYATRDQLASQALNIYFAAALTRARLADAEHSIERARRLRRFIAENAELGLSEEKDQLQADARLRARLAEQQSLRVGWEQQRTSLNRLTGRAWDAEFEPDADPKATAELAATELMFEEVQTNSAELRRYQQQITISDAVLQVKRDQRKDIFDLVLGVGARSTQGDTDAGGQSDEELVGGVRVEFSRATDAQGLDAEVRQAELDRVIALQEQQRVHDDLRYQVYGLVAEIQAAELALTEQQARLRSEQLKLDEAVERYRMGRIDTARLIDFEGDVFVTELIITQQRIELAAKRAQLDLLRGTLWVGVGPAAEYVERPSP